MIPFTSRRLAKQQKRSKQQLIAFQIHQNWFALPIQVVRKVVPLGPVYGIAEQGAISLTRYENQDVPVIQVDALIFNPPTTTALPVKPEEEANQQRYLLVVHVAEDELVGIPLEAQPKLCRVSETAFAPLPPRYTSAVTLHYVSALVTLADDQPPLFLLNLQQLLVKPLRSLPGASNI
jgi:chemotaxis signal transduction protein